MYANTCWGFLGLAVTFGVAMLGLPPEYAWLRVWFVAAALACLITSVLMFCWPLIARMLGLRLGSDREVTNAELRSQAHQLVREMRVYASGVQMELSRHYQKVAKPGGLTADEPDHEGNQLGMKLAQHFELDLRPRAVALREAMLHRLGRSAEVGGEFHAFALDGLAPHPYMVGRAADLIENIARKLP